MSQSEHVTNKGQGTEKAHHQAMVASVKAVYQQVSSNAKPLDEPQAQWLVNYCNACAWADRNQEQTFNPWMGQKQQDWLDYLPTGTSNQPLEQQIEGVLNRWIQERSQNNKEVSVILNWIREQNATIESIPTQGNEALKTVHQWCSQMRSWREQIAQTMQQYRQVKLRLRRSAPKDLEVLDRLDRGLVQNMFRADLSNLTDEHARLWPWIVEKVQRKTFDPLLAMQGWLRFRGQKGVQKNVLESPEKAMQQYRALLDGLSENAEHLQQALDWVSREKRKPCSVEWLLVKPEILLSEPMQQWPTTQWVESLVGQSREVARQWWLKEMVNGIGQRCLSSDFDVHCAWKAKVVSSTMQYLKATQSPSQQQQWSKQIQNRLFQAVKDEMHEMQESVMFNPSATKTPNISWAWGLLKGFEGVQVPWLQECVDAIEKTLSSSNRPATPALIIFWQRERLRLEFEASSHQESQNRHANHKRL